MLGSPIRTPPDHSSVANSPGLIAGSYVLHRLLMPRHPPCALHSLSHKHSTKTTKTLNTTTHTQTSEGPCHRALLVASKSDSSWCRTATDARVHYPIHKFHTHPSHTPRTTHGLDGPRDLSPHSVGKPDSSKLNSVPRPFSAPMPPGSTPASKLTRQY